MVGLPASHRWTRRRLSAYLEGELPRRAGRRLEAHLVACPQCHRTFMTLVALLGALPASHEQPLESLTERTVEHLRPRL